MGAGEGDRPQQAGAVERLDPESVGLTGQQLGQRRAVGQGAGRVGVVMGAELGHEAPDVGDAALDEDDGQGQAVLEGQVGADGGDGPLNGAGSMAAASTAASRASLSPKALKMVPSETPAAVASWREVTAAPCSISSGRTASMMAARRSSGGRGAARRRPGEGAVRGVTAAQCN